MVGQVSLIEDLTVFGYRTATVLKLVSLLLKLKCLDT